MLQGWRSATSLIFRIAPRFGKAFLAKDLRRSYGVDRAQFGNQPFISLPVGTQGGGKALTHGHRHPLSRLVRLENPILVPLAMLRSPQRSPGPRLAAFPGGTLGFQSVGNGGEG